MDDEEYTAPSRDIQWGVWIDTPNRIGFKDRAGIYLILAGSNSAYGNYLGGFEDVAAAERFNRDHLEGQFVVKQNA